MMHFRAKHSLFGSVYSGFYVVEEQLWSWKPVVTSVTLTRFCPGESWGASCVRMPGGWSDGPARSASAGHNQGVAAV